MTPEDRAYFALLCERVTEDPVLWEYGGPSESERALAAATLRRLGVSQAELGALVARLDNLAEVV